MQRDDVGAGSQATGSTVTSTGSTGTSTGYADQPYSHARTRTKSHPTMSDVVRVEHVHVYLLSNKSKRPSFSIGISIFVKLANSSA